MYNIITMVKNTKGGGGNKKFARKFTTSKVSNRLRVSVDEGELYAIVTKMLGNNMFQCYCIDGRLRLGRIRGKFAGRGKRDSMLSPGIWVLIGVREWEIDKLEDTSKKTKLQECDLLEVYSDLDKERLKDSVHNDWSILAKNDVTNLTNALDDDSGFSFATDKDIERDMLIDEMKSSTLIKMTLSKTNAVQEEEAEVDFNDI
jgi:initiation factor 1A